ncbi:DUF3786 domain-containing protein [Bacillota bacterium LX-D]|nr:DUF3786 domain-containing protein [Bacillota bacterium LX-D]
MKEPYNLNETYKVVVQQLAQKNPDQIAENTKVNWKPQDNEFIVPCLGEELIINMENWDVIKKSGEKLDRKSQILVLHYLNSDKYQPLVNDLVAFKQLPGAFIYQEPFFNRSIRPLIKFFGNNPGLLISTGEKLGGVKASFKDESITLYPFPMVPLTLVIHYGDDEFPATGNILFDSSVSNYFPAEDCTVLASWVVSQLGKLSNS